MNPLILTDIIIYKYPREVITVERVGLTKK